MTDNDISAIMKSFIFILIAVVLSVCQLFADENVSISSIQYWIDENHTAAMVSSSTEFDLDCSKLTTGLHTLNYRVLDNEGNYSALFQHSFLKQEPGPAHTDVVTLQYWWDDMHDNAVDAPYSSEEFVLSTDALPYGLHSLKYRVKDNTGAWSDLRTHYFYKGEPVDSARIVSYSYWWNDLNDKMVEKQLNTPAVSFDIDEDFTVPEEARTSYAGHYVATLNIIITDNHGRSVYLTEKVKYPDNDAPTTDIDADCYVASSSVNLTWKELSGDEMGDYNVYFSKDGGPFLLWLPDTKQTTATFKGESGSVYLFTVTGRDSSGNREEYDETKCVSVTFE